MKFFYSVNLTEKTLHTGVQPWDFAATERITEQIRHDKESRQEWYQNTATQHYFYTLIEGANPNQRPSKDNPPKFLHGIAADYDIGIPPERVAEAIKAMKVKPAYVERSLGGNVRLVWLFRQPIAVDTCEFCSFVLTNAVKWLNLDLLPALDEPAFVAFSRLLCNGCAWEATGHGPVPDHDLQAFFVRCGRDFRFQPNTDGNEIPLDVVEKALLEKFPNVFSWPQDFVIDSQGPSFWIPESTSPASAIVKKDGMFTFSGHADKPFYSWGDILGHDFVAKFATETISRATNDIWWDSKKFWRKKNGIYSALDMPELQNYFKVQCRLSNKPTKEGVSPVDMALDHIYNNGSIKGAAPFIFRPPGVLDFNGRRVINTWVNQVVKPSDEVSPWGPEGKFPFLSQFFDTLFDPVIQKDFFLAWWKHFYTSALTLVPMPGQNVFLMGAPGAGKTLASRAIIGKSVGGFMDAADFLIHSGQFNSEMFESPLWCVDDETLGESSVKQAMFQAMLKKITANQQFKSHKKFEIPVLCEWMGRAVITANLDYVSSRSLGPMDNSSADKTNIFRCVSEAAIIFPSRHQLAAIIEAELPYLLRWLLNWEPPAHVIRNVRYGYASYHEPTLLNQAHQSSRGAPFKELLVETLQQYFTNCPEAKEWRGTLTQLSRLLQSNPMDDYILRSLRLEQISRYLEMIQREGIVRCTTDTGSLQTRIWIFYKFGELDPSKSAPAITTQSENNNPFKHEKQADPSAPSTAPTSELRNPPSGPSGDSQPQ